jgi:hypothetical protein
MVTMIVTIPNGQRRRLKQWARMTAETLTESERRKIGAQGAVH